MRRHLLGTSGPASAPWMLGRFVCWAQVLPVTGRYKLAFPQGTARHLPIGAGPFIFVRSRPVAASLHPSTPITGKSCTARGKGAARHHGGVSGPFFFAGQPRLNPPPIGQSPGHTVRPFAIHHFVARRTSLFEAIPSGTGSVWDILLTLRDVGMPLRYSRRTPNTQGARHVKASNKKIRTSRPLSSREH